MININKLLSPYNFSSRKGDKIKYIILHYTGNKGDNALDNAKYFAREKRTASAHYFVSDNQIYQSVEDYKSAWSVGDGAGRYGITNSNSLNVEMCCYIDGNVSIETEANAVELVQHLMNKYNIDIDHVKRHYDASRKNCPNWSEKRWGEFKVKLHGPIKGGNKLLDKVKYKAVVKGSKGNHVYLLQSALTELGYNVKGIDGHCGPGLYNSICQYQRENGLDVDGSFGPACWTNLLK